MGVAGIRVLFIDVPSTLVLASTFEDLNNLFVPEHEEENKTETRIKYPKTFMIFLFLACGKGAKIIFNDQH